MIEEGSFKFAHNIYFYEKRENIRNLSYFFTLSFSQMPDGCVIPLFLSTSSVVLFEKFPFPVYYMI